MLQNDGDNKKLNFYPISLCSNEVHMEFQKIPNQHIWIRILRLRMQPAAEQCLINFDFYSF